MMSSKKAGGGHQQQQRGQEERRDGSAVGEGNRRRQGAADDVESASARNGKKGGGGEAAAVAASTPAASAAGGKGSSNSNKKPAPPPQQQNRFPATLHYALTDCPEDSIISWLPDGRSFRINDKDKLEKNFIPMWFRQTRYSSFIRQLSIYGFTRTGKMTYKHDLFRRDKPVLCDEMEPIKRKPTAARKVVVNPREGGYAVSPSVDGLASSSSTDEVAMATVKQQDLSSSYLQQLPTQQQLSALEDQQAILIRTLLASKVSAALKGLSSSSETAPMSQASAQASSLGGQDSSFLRNSLGPSEASSFQDTQASGSDSSSLAAPQPPPQGAQPTPGGVSQDALLCNLLLRQAVSNQGGLPILAQQPTIQQQQKQPSFQEALVQMQSMLASRPQATQTYGGTQQQQTMTSYTPLGNGNGAPGMLEQLLFGGGNSNLTQQPQEPPKNEASAQNLILQILANRSFSSNPQQPR